MGAKAGRTFSVASCIAGAILAMSCSGRKSKPETIAADSWNPRSAAAYLDQREDWWSTWSGAARDHDTFCVSCHTAMPYALSRPVLHTVLGEKSPSPAEAKLLENITKRVRLWKNLGPFYSDEGDGDNKTAQSRGTESVLNALILASRDARSGRLSPDVRTAFDNMWALQETTGDNRGAWPWLDYGLEPWEAADAQYYGAALAAAAVGMAPEDYQSSAQIQSKLAPLREYLAREYTNQSLFNRIVLLWGSGKLRGLLSAAERAGVVNEVLRNQRPDGGWCLATIALGSSSKAWMRALWKRAMGVQSSDSDGYATGLALLALQQVGVPRDNTGVKRGLSWLMQNQNATEGSWPAFSLNYRRSSRSNTGRFMDDAATAYAVLALAQKDVLPQNLNR